MREASPECPFAAAQHKDVRPVYDDGHEQIPFPFITDRSRQAEVEQQGPEERRNEPVDTIILANETDTLEK